MDESRQDLQYHTLDFQHIKPTLRYLYQTQILL
jgi:hypothetical protein